MFFGASVDSVFQVSLPRDRLIRGNKMRELILCSSRKYPQPPPALMEGDGNSEGKGGPKGNNFRGGLR